jgi:hypothetical protein
LNKFELLLSGFAKRFKFVAQPEQPMIWLNIIRANLRFKTVQSKEFKEVQKGAKVKQSTSHNPIG